MTELLRQIQARTAAGQTTSGAPAARLLYVGHQANLTMLEAVVRRCDISEELHLSNIVDFGNQSSAGAPAVLSQRWNELRAGDVVACVVVGSGLSWSSVQLEWV